MPKMHVMMGKLFVHKISPSEIREMDFGEMKYWSKWTDAINKERKRAADNIK